MSSPAPASSPIQVYDKYGRQFHVSREQWRSDVLPAALRSSWDNPDALYTGIVQALNDDFLGEGVVVDAIARLNELEPGTARAITTHAFVLLRKGERDEAQRLLEAYVEQHGPEAAVLNNLAKVYAERGDNDLVERTLWRSLEADPNMENSLGWFEALHRERGGTPAVAEAMRRVVALPNAWRARVNLARHALDNRDLPRAMALYGEALGILGDDIPAEALMGITGDLGKRGFLAQSLELGVPRFVPDRHGVVVGNNLIKAYLDSGRVAEARELVERLFALNRPDWKSALNFWDGQIAQAQGARNTPVGPVIEMTMYVIEGPVWSHSASPVARIFPPPPQGAPRVVFLGSTVEVAASPTTLQVQLSDDAGRLSRVLPLYLAEQAQFHSGAQTRSLFPWLVNAAGGSFLVTTAPPTDADALQRAKGGGACDFVVVLHVKAVAEPWSATMRVLRASDGKCVFQHQANATSDRPDLLAVELGIEIQRALEQHANTKPSAGSAYLPPAPPQLMSYLVRLEQLLAIRCATAPTALHGVREILEGCLHLCLDLPRSELLRALLADVVARMANIRPDVVAEFAERLRLLGQEHPLDEPAHSTLAAMIEAAIEGRVAPR